MQQRVLFLAALCATAGAVGCGGDVVRGGEGTADAAPVDVAADAAADVPQVDSEPFDAGPPVDVTPIDVPPTSDVVPIDVRPPRDVAVDMNVPDTRIPRCGDSVLDPGESCDDGNNVSGDGCSATCRFEARCGDGRVDPGEVCDDGNNRSGDGCRSDCLSNERCGNMIVDTQVGEVCDPPGVANCGMDCRSITTCGNNRVDPGEQCDDGNTTRWDGCGPDCRVEQGVVLNSFFFAGDTRGMGCDFTGDGRPDNTLGIALGPGAGLLNTAINNFISNGNLLLQLSMLGMTDPLGRMNSNTRVGWVRGGDGDADNRNNLDPGNRQVVQRSTLDMMSLPQASFQSMMTPGASMLQSTVVGGPEDVYLDLPSPMTGTNLAFRVLRGHISGTLVNDGTRITAFNDGTLCGGVPAGDLARIPNVLAMIPIPGGGGMRPADSTFLEAIVGGMRITVPLIGFTLNVGPAQPDIDIDGDGIERFEATGGTLTTAPRITACIDGNGTRIEGRNCVMDPRIADAFSAAFRNTGVWVRYVGTR